MKPRVLLLAPIHNWPGYLEQCAEEIETGGIIRSFFPKWQAHESWYRALVRLGADVRVHVYSDSILFNAALRSSLESSGLRRLKSLSDISWFHYLIEIQSQKPWDRFFRTGRLFRDFKYFFPDYLLISGGSILQVLGRQIWSKLRSHYPSTRFILFNGQSPATATNAEKAVLPFLDYVITNDEGHAAAWRQLGARQAVALPISAADPELMNTVKATESEKQAYRCDIAFVGTLKPFHTYLDRLEVLNSIADFDLGIWTPDPSVFAEFPKLRQHYRGNLFGAEMLKVFQSCRVGLNVHGQYMVSGANLRTFEIPSMGCPQLVDHCLPGLFTNGEDIVMFQGAEELRTGLKKLLKDESFRQRIAQNGLQTTKTRQTYVERFKALFAMLGQPL